MWSDARLPRRAALAGLLALAGCGFAPVYGTGDALRGTLAYEAPETVLGYRLIERLEDRLGSPRDARALLRVGLSVGQGAAAIDAEGDLVRFSVNGAADWAVVGPEGVEADGRVTAFTGYSATGSTVATAAAQRDAEARLAVILADMIVAQVLMRAGAE